MPELRIHEHPILSVPKRQAIGFSWNGQNMTACEGEMISSALFANGVHLFGHHAKDRAPLGIFCANGQCSQCTVIADGIPVKACMTKIQEGMVVESSEGLPELPQAAKPFRFHGERRVETDVLIIGGGPAGLSAAVQLGQRGIRTLIVDDKDRLGGKLVLQTHKFFGSIDDCHAGARGIDIAAMLEEEVRGQKSVKVWLNSTVLYVYSDRKVGVVKDGRQYRIVQPGVLLNAAGARERSLVFPGNTLPGVYGAGAFQTLVNRDLVRPSRRLFVVGGGNVGLIAAYHALQAGIDVVGLVEAMDRVGGYQVHANKIKRLGIPLHTRHTVLSADGEDHIESVTIGKIDDSFQPIAGTEKIFKCDTLLIAVGLSPVDEFFKEAKEAGMKAFAAGDAREIAEASSAMFSGRIAGLEIARELGREDRPIPEAWYEKAAILKSRPGPVESPPEDARPETGIMPVFHCRQKIPCNPCVSVCKNGVIEIPGDGLTEKPGVTGKACIGCNRCVFICPGLAISLVDYREDPENPVVSCAYEVHNHAYQKGDEVLLTDSEGRPIQKAAVLGTVMNKASGKTQLVRVRIGREAARRVAGFRIQADRVSLPGPAPEPGMDRLPGEAIVCRCERVTAGQIRKWIRQGIRDLNQLKAATRAGMGACGGKTCETLILQLYQEEGIPLKEVTLTTRRPLFMEAPLRVFAGVKDGGFP
jgi:NADPH-dependent 2,4-dienoyl-CoA reductase/sulfur reductase-like enzyme/Fe-S-cluster-containing hydrogenase component 2/bacterioferritin-associated ferredoxin